jgi:myo-inositol 2-dehydrogenase/D-chiro-inositol 1-dehydrogenase
MRIGVAGVGRIGALHAENLAGLIGPDSVLVADADHTRANLVAEKIGSHAVATVDALFDAGIDGLVVAVPTPQHAEMVVRSVQAGVPVFCEKPVAHDIAATRAVLEAVEGRGVPVQVGFQRRFDPGYVAARHAVESGALGPIHTIVGFTLDPAPPPAAYIPGSGGIFRDCLVHDLDVLRYVTGREVVDLYASGTNLGDDYIREADDVDAVTVSLTLDNGTLVQLSASRYNGAGCDVRMELRGHLDSVTVGLDARTPLRSLQPGVVASEHPPYDLFLDRFAAAYAAEMAAFTHVVAGGELANRPDTAGGSFATVADALAAFVLAEACDISRREGRRVPLGEIRA